jgi:hypothetical protein
MGCNFCNYSPCMCGRKDYGPKETREQYLDRVYGKDCHSCGGTLPDCGCYNPYKEA